MELGSNESIKQGVIAELKASLSSLHTLLQLKWKKEVLNVADNPLL